LGLLWENINRRNLHRATKNVYDTIGFLVGIVDSGRDYSLGRPDLLREDVSTRAPANPGSGHACAAILVIGRALVVLSDYASSRAGSVDPVSPVTSVSAFLMMNFQAQG
jgi:hypothetical protein